jgi:hypothetical protein
MKQTMIVMAAALAAFASAAAQEATGPQPERRVALLDAIGQVERARTMVESRMVTGAPYSADVVTESVQVLADGNRIARKNVSKVYRDSEGRTRREELGENGDAVTISISDPVAESVYTLDPRSKTAYRNGVIIATPQGYAMATTTPGGRGVVTATRTPDGKVSVSSSESGVSTSSSGERVNSVAVRSGGGGGVGAGGGAGSGDGRGVGGAVTVAPDGMAPGVPYAGARVGGPGKGTREDLGTQMIEGVMATGTRTTTVIEAGAIGNAQPIRIVSEQWFSPELKVLVMTKHSDPRTGETTYRLTNVTQTEPVHLLFEVPADYTLKDSLIRRQ